MEKELKTAIWTLIRTGNVKVEAVERATPR